MKLKIYSKDTLHLFQILHRIAFKKCQPIDDSDKTEKRSYRLHVYDQRLYTSGIIFPRHGKSLERWSYYIQYSPCVFNEWLDLFQRFCISSSERRTLTAGQMVMRGSRKIIPDVLKERKIKLANERLQSIMRTRNR